MGAFVPLANTKQRRRRGYCQFRAKLVCAVSVVALTSAILRLATLGLEDFSSTACCTGHLRSFAHSHMQPNINASTMRSNHMPATKQSQSSTSVVSTGLNGTVFDQAHTHPVLNSSTSLLSQVEVPRQCVCRRAISDVSWVENILVWEQPAQRVCNFHHFSPADAKKLLAKENIIVLGDSVSRQLAFNMAGMLLDKDLVTAIVDWDTSKHFRHTNLDALEFMGLPPNTTFHLQFFWGEKFPLISLKAQIIPRNATTAIISFGAWFDVAGLGSQSSILRHDLVSLVWTLCSSPGNTTFVIRLPTLSIQENQNRNLDYLRSLMLDLIFPNNATTVCCGNHSIVKHDTHAIMDKRSRGAIRLPATDNITYHLAPIMKVNLMQSVLNILPHLTKGGSDPCCVPVTDRFKAPVKNGTLEELVQSLNLKPECIASSHLTSIQTLSCAVNRSHDPSFNPRLPSHPALFFFFPLAPSASGNNNHIQLDGKSEESQTDSVWVLAKAKKADVPFAFSWYVNEVVVRQEADSVHWKWFELPKRSNRDWTWWTYERWCGEGFKAGCRVVKMVPRIVLTSEIAAVHIGAKHPDYQASVDILSQELRANVSMDLMWGLPKMWRLAFSRLGHHVSDMNHVTGQSSLKHSDVHPKFKIPPIPVKSTT